MEAMNEIYTKEELTQIRKNELAEHEADLKTLREAYKEVRLKGQRQYLRSLINMTKDSIQVIKWQIRDGV